MSAEQRPLVTVRNLRAFYGQVEALHGIDLDVAAGEAIVVLGANGAGKTTLLRALHRTVRTTGELLLDGRSMAGAGVGEAVALGVAHVPQGRGTLTELSVEDNLRAGAYLRRDRGVRADIANWYEVFPALFARRHNAAGGLSGGEQQMLAVARALMSQPRLLLLDEPSLGLSPVVCQRLFEVLAEVNAERGVAMVLVEQNAELAMELVTRGYVLEAGEVSVAGSADELRGSDSVRRAYLGY
jgi:branched-chain amino acid transport system ATP-binding protein